MSNLDLLRILASPCGLGRDAECVVDRLPSRWDSIHKRVSVAGRRHPHVGPDRDPTANMGSDDDGPGPDDDDHSPARENSDGWCANDLGYGDCAINDPTANRSARDDYFDY